MASIAFGLAVIADFELIADLKCSRYSSACMDTHLTCMERWDFAAQRNPAVASLDFNASQRVKTPVRKVTNYSPL